VRLVAFNKTEAVNWSVPWHQDRVIAVQARHNVPSYGAWSQKASIWHCEPPLAILHDMAFVRLHLDDADASTGAMEVALGSHKAGPVPSHEAEAVVARYPHETAVARRGDLQILHMLTLHRSRPATVLSSRRALRIDVTKSALPPPLAFYG
jgi:ectoine hydroxylase-related dioxygenase (phytanoyl-CoA dioxygenase family)